MRSPLIAVRVPPPMLARIDQFAAARCLGRAEAVRALLCNGFDASLLGLPVAAVRAMAHPNRRPHDGHEQAHELSRDSARA